MFVANIVIFCIVLAAEGFLIGKFLVGGRKNKWLPVIGVLVALVAGFFFAYEVKQTVFSTELELGSVFVPVPEEYLAGWSVAVQDTKIDTSEIDFSKTGTYTMRVQHYIQNFTVEVVIVDTTPPELELISEAVYIEKDTSYGVENLVQSTYDISGEVQVAYAKDYVFDSCGTKTLQVLATDSNGNSTVKEFAVIVDTAPVFDKNVDYYVALGEQADYGKYIAAYDDTDGNLTDRIITDASGVNCEEAGEYKVKHTVTDNYGLTAVTETTVRVMDAKDIQELINTHQISRRTEEIVGAFNLYDGGVFEGKSIEEITEFTRPSIVCLFYKTSGGWSRGSGFIISIDEEELVIATNYHVISKSDHPEVHFFDNRTAPGLVVAKGKLVCSDNDVALVSVKREDVPAQTMEQLCTVHISKSYYDSLGKNEKIELALDSMDQDGKIWFHENGVLVDKSIYYGNSDSNSKYGHMTQITIRLKPGVSGSAIVDKRGNFICMAVGTYTSGGKNTYYAVPFEKVTEMYRNTYGKEAYYE